MGPRIAVLAVACVLAAGCVSKKNFVAKSQEADLAAAALAVERQRSAELSAKAGRLEQQLAEAQKALAASRGEAARLAGQLGEAADQRDTLTRQLDLVQQSASRKDANVRQLTVRYDDLIKDLERQKADLSGRATDLSSRLAESESRNGALTGALANEQRRAMAAEEELAAARQALGRTKEALAERERQLRETTATYDTLVADLKGEIAEGQVKITQLRDKLTVNLVDKILFDSGSTAIKPRGQEVLRKVAAVLKTVADKRIQIEGHTDNVPVGGALQARFPTNWELSTARATVVARFLEEQGGIGAERLAAAGYGEHHPVASNESPEGRAENRRIEIVLLPLSVEAGLK